MENSILSRFNNSKEVKNAIWLIGGRVAQMLLSLVVGVLSARYLGPSNFGLIKYGTAFTSFFMSLCTLGINSIIIKDFFDNPKEEGKALGSTIGLRIVASFLSSIMIISFVSILDRNEPLTIMVVAICSLQLFFQSFNIINYWFQSRYKSKVTAIASFIASAITSVYKIILLIQGASVNWFAFAFSLDCIVQGTFLFCIYKKYNGPKLQFSLFKGKALLRNSYHYILSGMMIAIYGQTDKLMLKQMLNETAVGYYAAAIAVASLGSFILSAIVDSIYPTIMRLHDEDYIRFERKNKQLYALVFYISFFGSILIVLFGDIIIKILYGTSYLPAAAPLKVITWYTAFSYLGIARNAWVVCENKQKYLKYMFLSAAIINVLLNLIFIPKWGATGAALASLITQVCTSIVLPMFFKGIRHNSILMLESIMLKGVFNKT